MEFPGDCPDWQFPIWFSCSLTQELRMGVFRNRRGISLAYFSYRQGPQKLELPRRGIHRIPPDSREKAKQEKTERGKLSW